MVENTTGYLYSRSIPRLKPHEVVRFRRISGALGGALLALVFAFFTQTLVRLELPGVPLHQPPLGMTGNILIWLMIGILLGLITAWTDESLYGILAGSFTGTLIISITTFLTAGEGEVSTFLRAFSLFFTFMPIAALLVPLLTLLRWQINLMVDVAKGNRRAWQAILSGIILVLVVGIVGMMVRLPEDARSEINQTNEIIQQGLSSLDYESLPEILKTERVGNFLGQSVPNYELSWDSNHVSLYGIPRTSTEMGTDEAVVVARFANDWTLACLYSSPQAVPICKGIGGKPGESTFTRSVLDPFSVDWEETSYFQDGLVDAYKLQPIDGATIYHAELNLPQSGKIITGRQEVRYTNREDQPLREIYFHLYPNDSGGRAQILSAKIDNIVIKAQKEENPAIIRFDLPSALVPGESLVIDMRFEVELPEGMAGHYGLFGETDGIYALDGILPAVAVFDDDGWHTQPISPQGDNTFHDSSYYLVRVNAPARMSLVSSGYQVGGEVVGDLQSQTFATGPARDYFLAASDRFELIRERVGETMVNHYSVPEIGTSRRYGLRTGADALKVFNKRYSLYPYTELDLVSLPILAEGIEYPGVIGLAVQMYADAPGSGVDSNQIQFRTTIAHEVAHQWFYNMVGSDQLNDPWMDESLSQYAAWQYIVDIYGNGFTANSVTSYWRGCVNRTDAGETPVNLPAAGYETGRLYVGAVYCRGPLFVQELAGQMGVDNFDKFLKAYVDKFTWEIAQPQDFRGLAESICDCSLDPVYNKYFDEK